MNLSEPERRALNKCSLEWLSLPLLVDRERGQWPLEALSVLTALEERGLVKVRASQNSGSEFKISDAGILAVMAAGPVLAEPGS